MKLQRGLKLIRQIFAAAFSAIGGVWTVLEIIQVVPFSQDFLDKVAKNAFGILVAAGVLGAIGRLIGLVWYGCFRTFHKDDRTISVRIGNILNRKGGNIIVGVNDEYNTDISQIGQSSIHRQLLEKYTTFSSDRARLKQLFESMKQFRAENDSGTKLFQTTLGDKPIIFLPMSQLKGKQVATTTLEMVRKGLEDLFRGQEQLTIKNQTVYCPLLGTGEAGIHLSKEDTAKMIVRTYVICCGEMGQNSVDKIRHLKIIVHPRDCLEINWSRLNEEIAFILDCCDRCTN